MGSFIRKGLGLVWNWSDDAWALAAASPLIDSLFTMKKPRT
jgi:hypothetical protein